MVFKFRKAEEITGSLRKDRKKMSRTVALSLKDLIKEENPAKAIHKEWSVIQNGNQGSTEAKKREYFKKKMYQTLLLSVR